MDNPLPLAVEAAQGVVKYSDNQEEIKSIREGALDRYVAEREAYERYRAALVANGDPGQAASSSLPKIRKTKIKRPRNSRRTVRSEERRGHSRVAPSNSGTLFRQSPTHPTPCPVEVTLVIGRSQRSIRCDIHEFFHGHHKLPAMLS